MSSVINTTSRGSRIYPGVLQSFDTSGLSSSFQLLGTFSFPARVFKITNNSTVDVTISWDKVHSHEFVPTGSFILIDCAANKEVSEIFDIPLGTQFFVKGSSGTGLIYLSYYYAVSA
jgi:hypothetical protein